MTDVLLYQTDDDGDIAIESGAVVMSGGLETAIYLSMFGGNEQEGGRGDDSVQWWGNFLETEKARQYRSETQYLLRSIPAIPANLLRLEEAAKRDCAWTVTSGVATEVKVSASIPAINKIKIVVKVNAIGVPSQFTFYANWAADAGL